MGGAEKVDSSPIDPEGRARVSRAWGDLGRGRKGLGEGSKYRAGLTNSPSMRSFMEAGGGVERGVHCVNGWRSSGERRIHFGIAGLQHD